jgi:hypothetical protein
MAAVIVSVIGAFLNATTRLFLTSISDSKKERGRAGSWAETE